MDIVFTLILAIDTSNSGPTEININHFINSCLPEVFSLMTPRPGKKGSNPNPRIDSADNSRTEE